MWYYVIALLATGLLCVAVEYVSLYWDEYSHKAKHYGTYQYRPKEVESEVHNSGRRVHKTAWTA